MSVPDVNVGAALAAEMGRQWALADARERLVIALGWVGRDGANPLAIADYLREVAALLETDPLELLEQRVNQQHADLLALVAAKQKQAA